MRKPFLQTKLGHIVRILVLLPLAYASGSLAIDRGNLWLYALTLTCLILAIRQAGKVAQKGPKPSAKK
jgi:hypothetical protein